MYRAVDSERNILDFMLSAKRDGKAPARFFRKVLKVGYTQVPRVINVEHARVCQRQQNATYPVAADALNKHETAETKIELRQVKHLNNVIEQDHRNIKRIVKPMIAFKSFNSTRKTSKGIEAMDMIRKGQANGIEQGNSVSQAKFIEELFGVSA